MPLGKGITAQFLYIYGIPAWLAIRIACLIFKRIGRKKIDLVREVVLNLFAIYLIGLIGLVFLPVVFLLDGTFMNNPVNITIIPFEGVTYAVQHGALRSVVINTVGNLLMLSPLILFLKLLWNKSIKNYRQAFLLAFVVSFFIEFIQFLESKYTPPFNRVVDITDIILNSLGGLIGFYVYMSLLKQERGEETKEEIPGL
ncbi:VanZ family protein [Clostridium fungisolvens]|uniref:VanZ-like domain-containing protein n=1 Tax=Clostridium fungisolvens TaxID=1604897 RepID=A0A6V8SI68_9CLOT|nr:VanZ family protein [Clostridium fungisolvens]GFP76650.1 hypothetical protein bsdtw1_02753 [Clostridium fungisolvens]